MRRSPILMHHCRMLAYMILASLLTFTGAHGQEGPTMLRIGLRTKQPEVRLQGTVPLQVIKDEKTTLDIPAGQPLIFRAKDAGLTLTDANEQVLFTAEAPVRVRVNPGKPAEAENPPTPLISLVSNTKDKGDRLYRGIFEIMPQQAGLTVVNIVDMESYLRGVVSSEMGTGYPKEALKAQAIAARTYAQRNLGRMGSLGFDMDDTQRCQVYSGYNAEDPRTDAAVSETAGMVLVYNGELIDAVYSSTCGGVTESSETSWGKAVPYLVSVPDVPADGTPWTAPQTEEEWAKYFKTPQPLNCIQPKYARVEAFRWVKLMTRKEIEAGLPEAYQVGTVMKITPLKRGTSGRITALKLEGTERTVTITTESKVRSSFGGLRSSAFTVDSYCDDKDVPVVFAFWGAGWGHGIGMCQVGAVGLALQGWNCEKILGYYYRGASITKR